MSHVTAAVSHHSFFVGTYTLTTSRGIYAAQIDATTGQLSPAQPVAETVNPTFLALHPNGRVLYALRELGTVNGKPGGAVSAFTISPNSHALIPINEQPSGHISLTHLAVDGTGQSIVAVSYSGGYAVSFPLSADGHVGPRVSFLPHTGPLGPNPSRQDKPHPHSVSLAPDNRFALVADLGLDQIVTYRLDPATAEIAPNSPLSTAINPGSGPRHTKFSRDGKFFYVLNEIDGSITACTYDSATGVTRPFQQITTLPPDFQVKDADRAAEIRVHPNGKFLYASNRGHDSLAIFAIDANTGTLTLVEITPCGGKAPRNFALAPDGAWLVCAHQDANTLCSFSVDATTGRLTRVPGTISVPSPVCVLFAP